MLILTIIGYTILAIYEFKSLFKQKLWHVLFINGILSIFSLSVAILLCLNVHIPSPEKPIRKAITSVFGK